MYWKEWIVTSILLIGLLISTLSHAYGYKYRYKLSVVTSISGSAIKFSDVGALDISMRPTLFVPIAGYTELDLNGAEYGSYIMNCSYNTEQPPVKEACPLISVGDYVIFETLHVFYHSFFTFNQHDAQLMSDLKKSTVQPM